MSESLKSLIDSGTRLWLDSIDPDLLDENIALGATGATSNPIIVADLIKTGRFDDRIAELVAAGLADHYIAWQMTDFLVRQAQDKLLPVWQQTGGNDGYVSFEVDPLLEDPGLNLPHTDRVSAYVEQAKHWSEGHSNRMIKVPATEAGLDALEEIAAAGIPLNVTLIFTIDQYQRARDAIWTGASRAGDLQQFKSAYSIFVSRIDVYTAQHCSDLSNAAQGQVGIVNAKRIWSDNQSWWQDRKCPLDQEIIFASTGTKNADDPPWKYVAALAGSDIQTNPPATNAAVTQSGATFDRQVDQLPDDAVLSEIDGTVDFADMHATLMKEGIAKFATPQKELIELIGNRRMSLAKA